MDELLVIYLSVMVTVLFSLPLSMIILDDIRPSFKQYVDIFVISTLWPITLVLAMVVSVHNSFVDIDPEEKAYRRAKRLMRKKMIVEASIIVENEDSYITGKPMVFRNMKNWKDANSLVKSIVDDDESCFAIYANSRGSLPDDRVMNIHALQFVYRSTKTNEVLNVETYEDHQGPNTFFNRSWAE